MENIRRDFYSIALKHLKQVIPEHKDSTPRKEQIKLFVVVKMTFGVLGRAEFSRGHDIALKREVVNPVDGAVSPDTGSYSK